MAQVSRLIRKTFLLSLPEGLRRRVFERFPNFRKAAPDGMEFIFDRYLGSLRVNVNTRFPLERIMWTGDFEPKLSMLIQQRLAPGSVCIDVGANVGAITLALAKHVGGAGRVIAMEPAPPPFARLKANLELNPEISARVTAVNAGAGSEAATLYWTEVAPGNGA